VSIFGVSAFYHDSATAIIQNNTIIAAAQEERFTRKKQEDLFPVHAVKYCQVAAGLSLEDLDTLFF